MRRSHEEVGGVEGGALGGGASRGCRLLEPIVDLGPPPPQRLSEPVRLAPQPPLAPGEFEERLLASITRLEACARRLTNNPADAADLVQATCLRALENWHRFVEGSLTDFKKWVVTIMSNLHCDSLRKRQREVLSAELDEHPDEAVADEIPPWQAVTPASVAAAVSALPAVLHTPYVLYSVDHLSYAAIAKRLKVPPRTVGTRIFRARARLRVALTKQLPRDAVA
jgi:RNA polymerase sigma-70 factor (ECF subfamily)